MEVRIMAIAKSTTRSRLTKTVVEALGPGIAWDRDLKGFGVRVSELGTRTYFVHSRLENSRQVKVTIGRHGKVTCEEARGLAKKRLGQITGGSDPGAEKRAARQAERERRAAPTIADLWARYSVKVVADNRESTAAEKRRMWKRKIEPSIGTVTVRDVNADQMDRIIRAPLRLEPKTGRIVGGKGEAGNLYRLLHHLMTKAILWKMRPDRMNPLDEIDEPKVPPRKRLLRDTEMSALWAALAEMEPDEPWQVMAALRFAFMTGWRADEVVKLQHDYLHHDRGEARLPVTKTDFSARPLAPEVFDVIEALPRIVGTPWVFPAVGDATKPLSYNILEKAFGRLRAKAGLTGVSLHTLRHRIVTDIAGEAKNLREGMAVSGHKSVAAFMGYVHADRDRAAAIAKTVTARISGLANVQPDANVAELRRSEPA
jgi:integrase